jgi:glycosyltransferase involved in cell wall biosynthesis
MFSVVIPLYNKATYIQKSVNSVLIQSFKHFEIIIINDGSTDNSLEVIESINDNRIRIISQKNCGVSIARNNGVKASMYENIAFLDADDWWEPDFLKEFSILINEFPDAGIYGCRYWMVKNGISKVEPVGIPDNFKAGYINYFETYAKTYSTPFNCSFVVVNKSDFNNVGGFNPNLKFGEDFHLWARIALKYQVGYINKPLAFSNQDVEEVNRALGIRKVYNPQNHFIFNMQFLEEEEKSNLELKQLLDGLRVRSLLHYLLSQKFNKEMMLELKKVDFDKQTKYYKILYKYPKPLIQLYFWTKQKAYKVKQYLFR